MDEERDIGPRRQIITASIDIDAPIELVWETVSDPATFVEGIDWVYEAWTEDGGPLREGSVYIERAKPGPKTGTYRWEVSDWDPPRRAVHLHRGAELEAELEILFEPLSDSRTRYSQIMRFRALPRFRPLGFIVERAVMKRKMKRDFEQMILPNYKRIAEARRAASR